MGGSRDDSQKNQADQAAQQNQQQAAQYNTTANNLFGKTGGNISAMADPASLNISSPTGPSRLQYDAAVQNTSNQYQNAAGQLSRSMALRGFGADSPSGMQVDEQRQLAGNEADAQGANFSNYTNQSYQTALNDFWNANNMLSGQAAQTGQLGMTGGQGAASTYANLYANSYTPSAWATVGQIAGGLGAAALGNPSGLSNLWSGKAAPASGGVG